MSKRLIYGKPKITAYPSESAKNRVRPNIRTSCAAAIQPCVRNSGISLIKKRYPYNRPIADYSSTMEMNENHTLVANNNTII